MAREDEIRWEIELGVARITLDRPAVRNALAPRHRSRLRDLLDEASRSPEVRAVVLTGAGTTFCAGGDLNAAPTEDDLDGGAKLAAAEPGIGDVASMVRNAQQVITSILDCEKPVIGSLNGDAVGLGAQMALACDVVVAVRDARFRQVFVQRGLVPDGGAAWLLPRLVGLHVAKRLLLLGDDLTATQAEKLGIVTEITDLDGLVPVTDDLAHRLAHGPTRSIGLTKQLMSTSLDAPRRVAFEAEAAAQELAVTTHDAQEGMAAFRERRAPRFLGR